MCMHHLLDAWHEVNIVLSSVYYSFYVYIADKITEGQRLSIISKVTKSGTAGIQI